MADDKPQTKIELKRQLPVAKLVEIQAKCDLGMSDSEISEHVLIPVETVAAIIQAEGWRNPDDSPEVQSILEDRDKLMAIRWNRAVAAQARAMTMRGFLFAHDAATPRDFKDAAQATSSFAEIARKASGMDKPNVAGVANFNFIFCDRPVERIATRVDPEVESFDGP